MIQLSHGSNLGKPIEEGIYAAEIYYGWKLLNWRNGKWWHLDFVGTWPDEIPPVQWVGPLPACIGIKPKQEFDL